MKTRSESGKAPAGIAPPEWAPRILLHGHLGRGNVGDEAMLQVIAGLLRDRIPSGAFFVAYGDDTQPRAALPGHTTFIPRTFRSIVEHLRNCDFFVIAGGTHLTCFGKNKRGKLGGIVRQLLLVLAAKILGVKVLMLSVGIGPFNSMIARGLVRYLLRHVHFISVRDAESVAELATLNYSGPHSRCSDAAFFMPFTADGREGRGPCLGVSMLPFFATHMCDTGRDTELVQAFSQAIRAWLASFPEGEVLLLPICTQPGQAADTAITGQLARIFAGDARVREYPLHGNPDALMGVLPALSHFIGMRYHSVLLACMSGVPSINVAYHKKSLELASELAMPEASVISVDGVLAGDLVQRMPQFCETPERFLAGRRSPAFTIDAIVPQLVINRLTGDHEDSGNNPG